MAALTFQPYAENENQTKLFHHLKTQVTPEGFCCDAAVRRQLQKQELQRPCSLPGQGHWLR